ASRTQQLEAVQPCGDERPGDGEAPGRRILHGLEVFGPNETREQLGQSLARERGGVGEPAGERDDVRCVGEIQDGGERSAYIRLRARRERRSPVPRFHLYGHVIASGSVAVASCRHLSVTWPRCCARRMLSVQ